MTPLASPYDLLEAQEGPPVTYYVVLRRTRYGGWVPAMGEGERYPTCYPNEGAAEEAMEAWQMVCPDWTLKMGEEEE